jgi:hypothetical protein
VLLELATVQEDMQVLYTRGKQRFAPSKHVTLLESVLLSFFFVEGISKQRAVALVSMEDSRQTMVLYGAAD